MDLSIVITSYNTKVLLGRCLSTLFESLTDPEFSFEVIVVDNGSTDGSADMVGHKFPNVRLVRNTENMGFGKANNQAISMCRGNTILLLNSDTEVQDKAIQHMYAFSKTHTDSYVGPKLLNPDHTPQSSCGQFFSLPVVFASLFLKGDVLGITRWSPDKIMKVDWVSGACIMAPKHIFLDKLLFDERIFMYMEEIDLLYRAKKKGYTTYFFPESKVIHVGSGSSMDKRKSPIMNIFRGLQIIYAKHYPQGQRRVLRCMLQCKALLGIGVGIILGKRDLKDTYEKALRLVQ